MIFRYLLLGVAVIAVLLGIRQFVACTYDLIAYRKPDKNVYERLQRTDIVMLKQDRIKYGAATQPIVSLINIAGRKMALINMPSVGDSILIKRSPNLDSAIRQLFSEPVNTYEAIDSIFFYFFSRYVVSLFLILFGLLFLLASHVVRTKMK